MLRFQGPSVSQKVPVNERPPGSPTGDLMKRVALLHGLHSSIEVLLIKKRNFIRRPYGNRRPFREPYLAYPSGSPVKRALPPAAMPRSASNFPTRQKENIVILKHGIKSEMDV